MSVTLKQILDVPARSPSEPMLPNLPRVEPRPETLNGPERLAAAGFLAVVVTGCVLVVLVVARAIFGR